MSEKLSVVDMVCSRYRRHSFTTRRPWHGASFATDEPLVQSFPLPAAARARPSLAEKVGVEWCLGDVHHRCVQYSSITRHWLAR